MHRHERELREKEEQIAKLKAKLDKKDKKKKKKTVCPFCLRFFFCRRRSNMHGPRMLWVDTPVRGHC